jgi:tetratricopeptide (TPR) repeat protein
MNGPRRGAAGRRALFTVLAVLVVPAALLGALEAALRGAGVGESRAFATKERRDGVQVWVRNPAFARLFFEPQLAREAHPFALAVPKPAGEVRVFLLGASAANGIPEPAYGLARQLEVLLRERHPDARLEVVDVAITATNSHVTRRIAEASARMEPDLFVLYLGNNEVVGPYGPGTVFAPLLKSRGLIALDLAVRSSRLGQVAAALGRRLRPRSDARSWEGLEMFASRQVRADDPRLETVYRHFEANVRDVARAAGKAGAPIVLSTVGVNLLDCAPFASPPGDGPAAEDRFREGRAAFAAGDSGRARGLLSEARDLDGLRFRADSRINAVLRRVGEELAAGGARAAAAGDGPAGGAAGAATAGDGRPGVQFVDAAEILAAAAPEGIPGRSLFWEHVHLTFRGNAVLARAFAGPAEDALIRAGKLGDPARDWPDAAECAELLALTDWDRVDVARTVYNMMDQPPFSGQLGHEDDLAFLRAQVDSLRPTLREQAEAMLATYRGAMERGRPHWLLRFRFAGFLLDALGDAPGAAAQWASIAREHPDFPAAWNQLARAQARMKAFPDAERSLHRSLEVDPYQATAWSNLGTAVLEQAPDGGARRGEAIAAYERAVALGDEAAFLHNLSRARTLEARHRADAGDRAGAMSILRDVMERDPEYAPARELADRLGGV